MIPQFQDYKGSFPYKTDSKNRVNVVPSWRPPQGEQLLLMASISEGVNIIKVLVNEAVEYRLKKIELHESDPKKEAETKTRLKRLLRESSVNEHGNKYQEGYGEGDVNTGIKNGDLGSFEGGASEALRDESLLFSNFRDETCGTW